MIADPNNSTSLPVLKAKDFASDQDIRWCPGCGDYAVLSGVRKALPKLGRRKEEFVFISGIGCSSRFPYYMETYGLHSIHGRALPIATGTKLANPELQITVVSGDGDMLSIGGNHFIHALRRNIDLTILLLNNRIYGLTKGQYSPTSEFGKVTSTTPQGSIDYPLDPVSMAAAAGGTFIARTIDVDVKAFDEVYRRALAHKGTAFVEIYQDCNIFNHKAWFYASQKETHPETVIELVHGRPLVFGKERDKGIRINGSHPEVVKLGGGVSEADLVVHDETDRSLLAMYTQMHHPEFPEPIGVLHADTTRATYDELLLRQIDELVEQQGEGDLEKLLRGNDSWEVA